MAYDWLDKELEEIRINTRLQARADLEVIKLDMIRGKEVMRKICRGE